MKRCPICARSFPGEERFCSVHGLPLVGTIASSQLEEGPFTNHVLDNRYALGGIAGRGGMGIVYEAEHLRTGRRCAVKVLHHDLHSDVKMRMRLFREVQATSRVRHPNVVEILDFGDDEAAGSYLVMEFLAGKSLTSFIRNEGPLPLPFVFKVCIQLVSGLTATHSQGLIHRDLKPSNILLLPSGLVKILDFGLVKPFDTAAAKDFVTITTAGMAYGTPWYMSPEQASFKPLDQRSDIYSLGVVLYEMLTGRLPFLGKNPLELIDAHRSKPVPLPSALTPPISLPRGLELLLLKTLQKEPEQRYQAMVDLLDALYLAAQQCGIPLQDLRILEQSGPADLVADKKEAAEELDFTLPMPSNQLPVQDLRELVLDRMEELARRIVDSLRASIPRYRTIEPEALIENVKLTLSTALQLFAQPLAELPQELRELADRRSGQQFTPTEIIGAMWMELAMLRPLLREVTGEKGERLDKHDEQLDQLILSFVLKLVDYYFTSYHGRLVRLNEALGRQNEELMRLREALSAQVTQTSQQLVEVELLSRMVVDNISSGLLLVERQTQEVKIYNKAMERMSGFTSQEAVGRPVTEVLTFTGGVPYEEFREQIQLHGQVGLRKLWVSFARGTPRALYIRGQAFYDTSGKHISTLFICDDVTEREQIVESFSRYLSREVVDRILHQPELLGPQATPRQAAILSACLTNFRTAVKGLDPGAVVDLLTDYIRAVSDAVFHYGGTIDTMMGDGVLVYFDLKHRGVEAAVQAAINLTDRLHSVSLQRQARGLSSLEAGIGIHQGEVLVVDAGSSRRMVHMVVGEVALTAQALQQVASGGEILVSSLVAEQIRGKLPLENGPVLGLEGQTEPLEAFRVTHSPEMLDDPTLV
jgi:PAS domain S-box-containing protein